MSGKATPKPTLMDLASHLDAWQHEHEGKTKHRCLEAVRHCGSEIGLRLPLSNIDYEGMLAISCGKRLAKAPKRWGWKLVGTNRDALPTDRPTLVFFDHCGTLKDGRVAGHIAVFKPSTNHIVANDTYEFSDTWGDKIAYVFELA